ncbi:MAG: efflux transporter outer membrane subunit [Gammaproteobacteria bacterium]|nr:efflux transporter outer membrane subunit [Gammaproteobacteria bacterium]
MALLTATLPAACTVGPHYVRPAAGTGDFAAADPAAVVVADAVRADWWAAFDDPLLVELVDAAVAGNPGLRIAEARVREARALARASAASLLPSLAARGAGAVARLSENGPGIDSAFVSQGLADRTNDVYEASFDAAWELDLFGGNRRRTEAAAARAEAADEARRGVVLSLAAEIARTYVELRGAQRRLAILETNLDLQRQTLALADRKHQAGLAPELEPVRARAQFAATQAQIPSLQAFIRLAAQRLAVLTGAAPESMLERLLVVAPLPSPPDLVPVGLRSELLRRRPDIRAAERRLAAATADVGVAVAARFPSFALTGTGGVQAGALSALVEGASGTWALRALLAWPIFTGGRISSGIDASAARADVATAEYDQAVLSALEDVEGALVGYLEALTTRRRLGEAVADSREAAMIARRTFDSGLGDFLSVLDAERRLTEITDREASAQTNVATALVRLYKTLGGGWEPFEPPAAGAARPMVAARPSR